MPPGHTDPWEKFPLGLGLGVPAALGGQISPESLLGAQRRAIFCQPREDQADIDLNKQIYAPDVKAGDIPILSGGIDPYATLWWSPATRYVIPVEQVRVGRSLRRTLRTCNWNTSLDRDFNGVIAGCREGRSPRWITDQMVAGLRTLHQSGWVHTAEVWDREDLIAGVFGYAIGSVFVMESSFHRKRDAGKVAIVDLACRSRAGGLALLDFEVESEYAVGLGACPLAREDYLRYLQTSSAPSVLDANVEHVSRLIADKP